MLNISVRPQGTGLMVKEVKDFGYYSLALTGSSRGLAPGPLGGGVAMFCPGSGMSAPAGSADVVQTGRCCSVCRSLHTGSGSGQLSESSPGRSSHNRLLLESAVILSQARMIQIRAS
jgi:hypothetical protein